MTDEDAFIAAIRSDPKAGTHLIFADWLDDHGRHEFASRLREPWAREVVEWWASHSRLPLPQTLEQFASLYSLYRCGIAARDIRAIFEPQPMEPGAVVKYPLPRLD